MAVRPLRPNLLNYIPYLLNPMSITVQHTRGQKSPLQMLIRHRINREVAPSLAIERCTVHWDPCLVSEERFLSCAQAVSFCTEHAGLPTWHSAKRQRLTCRCSVAPNSRAALLLTLFFYVSDATAFMFPYRGFCTGTIVGGR